MSTTPLPPGHTKRIAPAQSGDVLDDLWFAAPALSPHEARVVARFEQADPAPESWDAQMAYADGRWCGECRYGVTESPACCS